MRRRIAYALSEHELNAGLQRAGRSGAARRARPRCRDAIVVLACDVDLPREMAALRRLRRELREPAIVAVSPMRDRDRRAPRARRRRRRASSSSRSWSRRLPSPSAPSPAASRWSRASFAPASSDPPSPTASARSSPSSRAGLTNAQIAEQLFLSESTIKSHLSSAFAKFGVRSRKEAAALFLELEQTAGALPTAARSRSLPPTP